MERIRVQSVYDLKSKMKLSKAQFVPVFKSFDERAKEERRSMEYQEFLCVIREKLNEVLKGDTSASIYTAPKNNNNVRQGILIETKGTDMSPAIYLEDFYERVKEGESINAVVQELLDFYEGVKGDIPWDCEMFRTFEQIRDKIVLRLINTEENAQLLKEIPSVSVLDLSLVFCVLLGKNEKETASMQIRNEHMKNWGVKVETLYKEAVNNAGKLLPAEFFTMKHAIEEMLETEAGRKENLLNHKGKDNKDTMYILTNPIRSFGAACMMYPHVLEMIGEMLKEDFFILPSSVHEVIIVPETEGLEDDVMNDMVAEINETQVAPVEVLSNHTYFYRREGKKLMMRRNTR